MTVLLVRVVGWEFGSCSSLQWIYTIVHSTADAANMASSVRKALPPRSVIGAAFTTSEAEGDSVVGMAVVVGDGVVGSRVGEGLGSNVGPGVDGKGVGAAVGETVETETDVVWTALKSTVVALVALVVAYMSDATAAISVAIEPVETALVIVSVTEEMTALASTF